MGFIGFLLGNIGKKFERIVIVSCFVGLVVGVNTNVHLGWIVTFAVGFLLRFFYKKHQWLIEMNDE